MEGHSRPKGRGKRKRVYHNSDGFGGQSDAQHRKNEAGEKVGKALTGQRDRRELGHEDSGNRELLFCSGYGHGPGANGAQSEEGLHDQTCASSTRGVQRDSELSEVDLTGCLGDWKAGSCNSQDGITQRRIQVFEL